LFVMKNLIKSHLLRHKIEKEIFFLPNPSDLTLEQVKKQAFQPKQI